MTTDDATATQLDAGNSLAPEPAMLTGARIGYARVSTSSQLLDRQLRALTEAGCLRVFADTQFGMIADRPELAACLDYLRPGDILVVPSLDRLSRSLLDLIGIVAQLRCRGVGFCSLHEALDTTTPGGRLVFHVFAALAEFIRELIAEGTHEGLARGVRLGRPPAMTLEQVRHARDLLSHPGNSVASIARLLEVSRSTIYKYVPELTDAAEPHLLTRSLEGAASDVAAFRQGPRPTPHRTATAGVTLRSNVPYGPTRACGAIPWMLVARGSLQARSGEHAGPATPVGECHVPHPKLPSTDRDPTTVCRWSLAGLGEPGLRLE